MGDFDKAKVWFQILFAIAGSMIIEAESQNASFLNVCSLQISTMTIIAFSIENGVKIAHWHKSGLL